MLTPNEIAEKKFDRVMVWGYDMNAVDSFIESVSADYAQLYKENIALKNKMKVLVSKIEEYRSVDESMRQALAGAKNLAAEMSANAQRDAVALRAHAESEAAKCRNEAQAEAARLREEAQAEAARLREEAISIAARYRTEAQSEAETSLATYKERIAAEEMRLEEAKTNVQVFIDKSIELYRKELDALVAMREQELSYEIAAPVKPADDVVVPPAVTASIPTAAPVIETPAMPAAPVTAPAAAAPQTPVFPAAAPASEEELILPDTITLPDLPPIPTARPAAPAAAQPRVTKSVYEVDTDDEEEDEFVKPAKRRIDEVAAAKRAAAQRTVQEEDGEETIVLTPKPRFDFSNLQFGDKYNSPDRKRK